MFKRILVAADGSSVSGRALEEALGPVTNPCVTTTSALPGPWSFRHRSLLAEVAS